MPSFFCKRVAVVVVNIVDPVFYRAPNAKASFLIGAGVDHYIASGGWMLNGKQPVSRDPILDRPLGAPLSDGVYNAVTTVWSRSFASGTKVTFNASCTPNRKSPTCPGTSISWGEV